MCNGGKLNVHAIIISNNKCDLDYDEQSSHTSVMRQQSFLSETVDVQFSGLYSKQVVSAVEIYENVKSLSVLRSPEHTALNNCGQQHVCNVIADSLGQRFNNSFIIVIQTLLLNFTS